MFFEKGRTAHLGHPEHAEGQPRAGGARVVPMSEDHMNGDRMFALAQALAVAKSRQDVPAAMKLFHEDMLLENPAFGTEARGLAENENVLTRFFTSFPDYNVVLQGHAGNDDTLICWGTVQMTMTGDRFGVIPNGRRAELPVFIQFAFKDDLIAGERFFFDLSALCAQSGVSTDAVRRKVFGDAAASQVAAK
jgi:SnoaL-like polyketide cyclase.